MIEIKEINIGQLEEMLNLQDKVHEQLSDKEVLQTLTKEEFIEIVEQGFIVGAFDGSHLVASRSMYIPKIDEEEHLADDAGIADKGSVIYSEISFINPEYRGQNLQTQMGRALVEKVKKDSRFKHCLTTVMPTNIPSLKDKFKLGFKIMATNYKYNGKRRHILRLDLEQPFEVKGEALKIRYDNVGWMMENGDDYIGSEFDGTYIYYYKKQGE